MPSAAADTAAKKDAAEVAAAKEAAAKAAASAAAAGGEKEREFVLWEHRYFALTTDPLCKEAHARPTPEQPGASRGGGD